MILRWQRRSQHAAIDNRPKVVNDFVCGIKQHVHSTWGLVERSWPNVSSPEKVTRAFKPPLFAGKFQPRHEKAKCSSYCKHFYLSQPWPALSSSWEISIYGSFLSPRIVWLLHWFQVGWLLFLALVPFPFMKCLLSLPGVPLQCSRDTVDPVFTSTPRWHDVSKWIPGCRDRDIVAWKKLNSVMVSTISLNMVFYLTYLSLPSKLAQEFDLAS